MGSQELADKDMYPFVYYLLLLAVAWTLGPAWLGPAAVATTIAAAVAYFAVKSVIPEV